MSGFFSTTGISIQGLVAGFSSRLIQHSNVVPNMPSPRKILSIKFLVDNLRSLKINLWREESTSDSWLKLDIHGFILSKRSKSCGRSCTHLEKFCSKFFSTTLMLKSIFMHKLCMFYKGLIGSILTLLLSQHFFSKHFEHTFWITFFMNSSQQFSSEAYWCNHLHLMI